MTDKVVFGKKVSKFSINDFYYILRIIVFVMLAKTFKSWYMGGHLTLEWYGQMVYLRSPQKSFFFFLVPVNEKLFLSKTLFH